MKKLILILFILIGVVGVFMPWFSLPLVGGPRGIDLDLSWLGIALIAINILPILLGSLNRKGSGVWSIWLVITGALSLGFGLLNYYRYKSDILDMGDGNFIARAVSGTISLGPGFIMYMAAALVILVTGLLSRR